MQVHERGNIEFTARKILPEPGTTSEGAGIPPVIKTARGFGGSGDDIRVPVVFYKAFANDNCSARTVGIRKSR